MRGADYTLRGIAGTDRLAPASDRLYAAAQASPRRGVRGGLERYEASEVPGPVEIFGGLLAAWWDSREGVTTQDLAAIPRVVSWVDKVNGFAATGALSTDRPRLLASDVDGQASVWWESGYQQTLSFGASGPFVGEDHTLYAFFEPFNNANQKAFVLQSATNTLHFAHAQTAKRPAVYRSAWWAPAGGDRLGWRWWRFSGDASDVETTIKVDADAQLSSNTLWWGGLGAYRWSTMSHTYSGDQALQGHLRHLIMIHDSVTDGDARDEQMRAWVAREHPSMVQFS